jgi:nitrogen regulatory protein P-II 2
MIKLTKVKLVTIIAESFLETRLRHELTELGAKGFTVSPSRGLGTSQRRADALIGENVRIEIVVSEEVRDKVLKHLQEDYFNNYSLIVLSSDVEVVRPEKYL